MRSLEVFALLTVGNPLRIAQQPSFALLFFFQFVWVNSLCSGIFPFFCRVARTISLCSAIFPIFKQSCTRNSLLLRYLPGFRHSCMHYLAFLRFLSWFPQSCTHYLAFLRYFADFPQSCTRNPSFAPLSSRVSAQLHAQSPFPRYLPVSPQCYPSKLFNTSYPTRFQ